MLALQATNPVAADGVRQRARIWIDDFGADFPGDLATGLLGSSDPEQARFDEFANDAACPALNLTTGLCDLYAWRPMTCRVFGPPTRVGEALGCCELCFVGATEAEIASCEMQVPHELEAELVAEFGDTGETVVAFALLR